MLWEGDLICIEIIGILLYAGSVECSCRFFSSHGCEWNDVLGVDFHYFGVQAFTWIWGTSLCTSQYHILFRLLDLDSIKGGWGRG